MGGGGEGKREGEGGRIGEGEKGKEEWGNKGRRERGTEREREGNLCSQKKGYYDCTGLQICHHAKMELAWSYLDVKIHFFISLFRSAIPSCERHARPWSEP